MNMKIITITTAAEPILPESQTVVLRHRPGVEDEVVVGQHDPLGWPRGAAGVDQVAAQVGRRPGQPSLQLGTKWV